MFPFYKSPLFTGVSALFRFVPYASFPTIKHSEKNHRNIFYLTMKSRLSQSVSDTYFIYIGISFNIKMYISFAITF